MKIKEHLYKYIRKNNKDREYYIIKVDGKIIATRGKREKIEEVYSICEKYNWDNDTIQKNIKEIKTCRSYREPTHEMRNIYKNTIGSYYCASHNKYMCCSSDLNKIKEYRDYLEENEWDVEKLRKHFPEIKTRNKHNTPQYIHQTPHGKYQIRYRGSGYGTFNNLREAIEERDLLIQHNWEYDFVDLV